MIDKDEYPQTAEIEARCVSILADLWHAPERARATGCSTTGSSEACMLGGMALLWRWRERRRTAGADTGQPNLVMGANVQVCWEKFCRYWQVEPRLVPMEPGRLHLTGPEAAARCDENTIGVVAVLGSTMDGSYEPVAEISDELDRLAAGGGPDIADPRGRRVRWLRRPVPAAGSRAGTSGCRGSSRSTPPGTSTAWCTRASAGWSGGTPRRCRRTWCSGSTTSAARCRRSR